VAAAAAERRRADAPWAVGRSGPRRELGRSTSGVLGEVYNTEPNPQVSARVPARLLDLSLSFAPMA
jgi:hypothetical protein